MKSLQGMDSSKTSQIASGALLDSYSYFYTVNGTSVNLELLRAMNPLS